MFNKGVTISKVEETNETNTNKDFHDISSEINTLIKIKVNNEDDDSDLGEDDDSDLGDEDDDSDLGDEDDDSDLGDEDDMI